MAFVEDLLLLWMKPLAGDLRVALGYGVSVANVCPNGVRSEWGLRSSGV